MSDTHAQQGSTPRLDLSTSGVRPNPTVLSLGALTGILICIWSLPAVRSTFASQAAYAVAASNVAWMRAIDSRHKLAEAARLDDVAQGAQDDYLLQVGRATALADAVEDVDENEDSTAVTAIDDDQVVARLYGIAMGFPSVPGGYAHLARYMMSSRVRIQRVEIQPAAPDSAHARPMQPVTAIRRTVLPRRSDARLMEWALLQGAHRDPDNAFWPAMLATCYFADGRDTEALQALDNTRMKRTWNAYVHEEILGQWRLYSSAYGDNGAAQMIGPLTMIAFPHIREIRRMAEMARWKAAQAEGSGKVEAALRILRDVAWLGIIIRERTQWAYEALLGTDLFFIATTPETLPLTQNTLQSVAQWEIASEHYRALLAARKLKLEIAWSRQEAQACCDLRNTIDLARANASYPGIPPGIPIMALLGQWMTGVCLLEEVLTLVILAAVVAGWRAVAGHLRGRFAQWARRGMFVIAIASVACGVALLFAAYPAWCGVSVAFLGLSGMCVLASGTEQRDWTLGDTGLLLVLTGTVGGMLLVLGQAHLAALHPIATLLAGLAGVPHRPVTEDIVSYAALAGFLPAAMLGGAGLFGWIRRRSFCSTAVDGLRRGAVPALVCLALVYLVSLRITLRLDRQTTRSMNEAAMSDLNWTLAHPTSGRG